jgi:phage-related protein
LYSIEVTLKDLKGLPLEEAKRSQYQLKELNYHGKKLKKMRKKT